MATPNGIRWRRIFTISIGVLSLFTAVGVTLWTSESYIATVVVASSILVAVALTILLFTYLGGRQEARREDEPLPPWVPEASYAGEVNVEPSKVVGACLNEIAAQQHRTSVRLIAAKESVARRSNINLYLGIVVTTAGVAALVYFLPAMRGNTNSTTAQFLFSFLPRVTLILVLEIFAYFFLNLYRSMAEDVKYYHNEISNVDARCLAAKLAVIKGNEASFTHVVQSLATTERNVILHENDLTPDLKRRQLEQMPLTELLREVKDIVQAANPKSDSR